MAIGGKSTGPVNGKKCTPRGRRLESVRGLCRAPAYRAVHLVQVWSIFWSSQGFPALGCDTAARACLGFSRYQETLDLWAPSGERAINGVFRAGRVTRVAASDRQGPVGKRAEGSPLPDFDSD